MASRVAHSIPADLALLVGRIMLALLYIMSGWSKLTGFGGTVQYLGSLGAPSPMGAAVAAVVVELGGAVCVALGLFTRLAAAGLVVFTAAATYLAHLYWTMPVEQQMIQYIMFWKNVGMAGGFLVLAGVGAGRFSLDALRR